MAQSSNDRGGLITGINVTPLVDITLVLLIIFIVTAKIMVTPALPIDLPKASQGQEVQVIFSVVLTADGVTHLNGAPIGNEEVLLSQATASLAQNPGLRAVIQADGDVPHRRVMATMDVLKRSGIERIAFAIEPVPRNELP
jgi:biopolymer transport protein ExbD